MALFRRKRSGVVRRAGVPEAPTFEEPILGREPLEVPNIGEDGPSDFEEPILGRDDSKASGSGDGRFEDPFFRKSPDK